VYEVVFIAMVRRICTSTTSNAGASSTSRSPLGLLAAIRNNIHCNLLLSTPNAALTREVHVTITSFVYCQDNLFVGVLERLLVRSLLDVHEVSSILVIWAEQFGKFNLQGRFALRWAYGP